MSSSPMYAIYRQTDPPTAVDFATYCRFLNLHEKNLVVAGPTHLRVYRLNHNVSVRRPDGTLGPGTKLECALSINLYGCLASMDSCYIPGLKSDCLLLAFEEAKISIVQYDPEQHDVKTISMHSFDDEFLKAGFTHTFVPPVVRADPENRCAAMLMYGRHLAILPFTKDKNVVEEMATLDTSANSESSPHHQHHSSFASGSVRIKSYTVMLRKIEERLQNVTDLCFLHGYYEPTLLLLYEPFQTTTGRAAVRFDTYCILAVSLNVKDQVHAVIWTVNQLPLDCFKVIPVPKPVGGVIVFAVNSIIYLNQSVPAYGVSVNSNMREVTSFPLRSLEDKQITFDLCSADFIAPKTLVVSLKIGDLYVLTLLVDNMNTVKSIQLEKAAASVIPSITVKCDDGFVFLGSRLGNSLLLKYWERSSYSVKIETMEPKIKRMRGDVNLQDDMEIYGEVVALKTEELMKVIQYSFDVCDSILNLGPCINMTVGEPAVIPEEFLEKKVDPIVDFVSVAGHGKNGALCVFQRSVRPHLITSSAIANARSLFTVGQAQTADGEGLIEGAQKYLLISKEVDTMVLEMRAEITELETSGFQMNTRTVAAGDLGRFIVQITPMSCLLLENNEKIQEVKLNTSFPVGQACILDPYVVLLTDNGEILLAELIQDHDMEEYRLEVTRPPIAQHTPATAISIYKDLNAMFALAQVDEEGRPLLGDSKAKLPGLFRQKVPETVDLEPEDTKPSKTLQPLSATKSTTIVPHDLFAAKTGLTADDEDALLYGDDDDDVTAPVQEQPPAVKVEVKQEVEAIPQIPSRFSFDSRPVVMHDGVVTNGHLGFDASGLRLPARDTYWLAVCRTNGVLEIFALPQFKLVYMVRKFPVGFRILHDTDPLRLQLEGDRLDNERMVQVRELLLVGLGANKARPFLFAVVEHELFVYEAFPYWGEGIADHLALRFKRIQHRAVLRNLKLTGKARFRGARPGVEAQLAAQQAASLALPPGHKYLNYFENISSYSGVFINGPYPFWVFASTQGLLRFHPMNIDDAVLSFGVFHNINCYQGFIYLNSRQEMRICQLPTHISYDCSIPVHKVSLKTTAHFIVYLTDSKTYAVALSTKKPLKTLVTLLGDDKQFEVMERDDPNFVYPQTDAFSVQLFSPETWDPVPGGTLDLEDFEHVTAVKEVQLLSEGTVTGQQNYLCVGTCSNYGEEVLIRGRVLICEVIEVVPEPDQPLTKHKIKVLYNKEQKGPVSSLCSISGYLLTGMAQKVYIWQFKDNDLVGISFLDMQVYVHQMISIRNVALVADVFRSISLLRYQVDRKALSMASRDARQMETMAIDFVVDNIHLAFLATDGLKNLFIYQYQPEARESNGGQRLLRRADFNTGGRINSICRIRCHVSDPTVDQKTLTFRRHMNWFGTLEGAIGFLLPVPEKTYRRLFTLQSLLTNYVSHYAGLNPKSFRAAKNVDVTLQNAQRNILDGDLLWNYLTLSTIEKQDLAKRIGTTKEQILDDMLEIERSTTHY